MPDMEALLTIQLWKNGGHYYYSFVLVFLFSEGFLVRGHCLVCGQEAKKLLQWGWGGEKIDRLFGLLGFFSWEWQVGVRNPKDKLS